MSVSSVQIVRGQDFEKLYVLRLYFRTGRSSSHIAALLLNVLMKLIFTVLTIFLSFALCHAEIRILGEDSPPGEYLDANGNVAGATIDLVNVLLDRQGMTASIQILPWNRAYQIGLHDENIALLETTRTEERESLFKWVGPILIVKRILSAPGNFNQRIANIDDLKDNFRICVLRGSSGQKHLLSLGIKNVDTVTKPAQCMQMLIAGHGDLFYTSDIGMDGLLKKHGIDSSKFTTTLMLKKEYLYIAFSKDVSDEHIQNWQAALETAKKDGTVAKIYSGVYPEETIKEVCLPGDPLARQ